MLRQTGLHRARPRRGAGCSPWGGRPPPRRRAPRSGCGPPGRTASGRRRLRGLATPSSNARRGR
eukprot:4709102-Lingulodinium_polyedra.AAC.1